MPTFAYWNIHRLGSGSNEKKKQLYEGVLAEIEKAARDFQFFALCEITKELQLGVANVETSLLKATRSAGKLAYRAINPDPVTTDDSLKPIKSFEGTFGPKSWSKVGNIFMKRSKRPMAKCHGGEKDTPIFIYHSNASHKSNFLVVWAATTLAQETDENFILAGDLNCDPTEFQNELQQYEHQLQQLRRSTVLPKFQVASDGNTYNAKTGLSKTYDWAIAGSKTGEIKVKTLNFSETIAGMRWTEHASDHLPILVTYA